MTADISIIVKPSEEKNQALIEAEIFKALEKKGIFAEKSEVTSVFIKKSIDARHGQVKILLRYKIYIGEKPNGDGEHLPVWKKAAGDKKVIIVGSGPAGLYAAFRLLEDGIKPIVVERGSCTEERKKDIVNLESEGKLNAESNFCFGEGGAGTFSDGKLSTRSNKRGDIGKIYRIFVEFGAPERILTDAHPHIGTDKLPEIISGMRKKIIELGGDFYFDTLCTN
ncbi:MAG: FAD-dependent monooxygenase, partial [Treponema sp.]|nr:FAD-dependent monooxygenase [Treponema sp.]